MHPSTYLNNKCWNDEIITEEEQPLGTSTYVKPKAITFEEIRKHYIKEYNEFKKYKISKTQLEHGKTYLDYFSENIKLILKECERLPDLLKKGQLTAKNFADLIYLANKDGSSYSYNLINPNASDFYDCKGGTLKAIFDNFLWKYNKTLMETFIFHELDLKNRMEGYNGYFSRISKDEILKLL